MADLRQPREPRAIHVPEADGGEAALFRRHPAHGRRISGFPSTAIPRRRGRSGSAIPSGTSTTAIRRPKSCIIPARANAHGNSVSFGMLLNLAARRQQRGRQRAVGLPAALRARPRRRTIRVSTGSSAMPSPISAISCGCRRISRCPTMSSAAREQISVLLVRLAQTPALKTSRRISTTSAGHSALSDFQPSNRAAGASGRLERLFNMLYQVPFGEDRGPRFGSFRGALREQRDAG